ncbi:MAG: hypothetical protein ABEI86_12840, partial [Halobacteriaceae archaeon]
LVSVLLLAGILINAGVFGTILNEKTMQPNLDRQDILTSEDNQRLFNLKANYATKSELQSSKWALHYVPSDENIYGSGGGGLFGSYFLEDLQALTGFCDAPI